MFADLALPWRPATRAVVAVALCACGGSPAGTGASDKGARPPAEVLSCVDLPRDDPRSHDLSGLAWDPDQRLLYALSDREERIVVLAPHPGFTGYDLRPAITLNLPVERWDGEALALADGRFLLVADETAQEVFSVERSGLGATRVALPPFRGVRHNLGLEGLGYIRTAHNRFVFVINEEALEGDGPTSTVAHGTVVRLLRHPLDGGDDLEVAYLTDPIFTTGAKGDNGVSDIVALSTERVLVLERAWVRDKGNAVRLYEVDLRTAHNVMHLADARAARPVRKRLVVDLALLPDERCPATAGMQRRRTLENYEGMALGPTLGDGRRVLFLVSDDNSNAIQDARVLALALAPGAL